MPRELALFLVPQLRRALAQGDNSKLLQIVGRLSSHGPPSIPTLSCTGIGKLVCSKKLHSIREKGIGARFQAVSTRWREAVRTWQRQPRRTRHDNTERRELVGFLRNLDVVAADHSACTRVANAFLANGFMHWQDLPGANPVPLRCDSALLPSDKALLGRAIDYAEVWYAESIRARARANLLPSAEPQSANGERLADRIVGMGASGDGTTQHLAFRQSWGYASVGSNTPMAGVQCLASARQRGLSAVALLDNEVSVCVARAAPSSLPQIASGLRCWHKFATEVLGINADATIPPMADDQVILFTTIFRNAGTCKNYLSALRYACRVANVAMEWDTDRLAQAVRAVEKNCVHDSKPRTRILRALVCQLMRHAVLERCHEEAAVYSCAFQFLFRVEDECLPLEVGDPSESEANMVTLPFGRHSAVWVDRAEIVVRLRSRKNKPHGATIRRGCSCLLGQFGSALCALHTIGPRLAGLSRGAKLFPHWCVKGGSPLRFSLHRRLAQLDVQQPQTYGLQSFRRGHAHQIMLDGGTLADVLKAGQWASPAFLLYLDRADIEHFAVVQALLEDDHA